MARRACNRLRRVSRSGSRCSAILINAREVLPRALNNAVHRATRASSDLHEVERRTCINDEFLELIYFAVTMHVFTQRVYKPQTNAGLGRYAAQRGPSAGLSRSQTPPRVRRAAPLRGRACTRAAPRACWGAHSNAAANAPLHRDSVIK